MIDQATAPLQIVLFEADGASTLDEDLRFSIVSSLLDRGYRLTCVGGDGNPTIELEPSDRTLIIGAFENGGPASADTTVERHISARDIGQMNADAVLNLVNEFRDQRPMNQPPAAITETGQKSWKPWFPVIDYDRCTNCMQCLSFCLFDVYSVDEENQIQVLNQDNCKTNCPACSRVCPEVAIMFPKYGAGPINGEPVSEGDVKREKMKVDISALLGGNIYERLRDRSVQAKSRFSKERSSDKALKERVKCLKKLKTDGMIPQEVLDELDLSILPSAEEIQRKAKEAAAKAQAALDARK